MPVLGDVSLEVLTQNVLRPRTCWMSAKEEPYREINDLFTIS